MIRPTLVAATMALLMGLGISGCGSPATLDTSSDAALDASMKRMTAGFSEEQRNQFGSDCMVIVMPDVMKAAFGAAFSREKPAPPSKTEVFRPLHGLTVAQIRAKAEGVREKAKR